MLSWLDLPLCWFSQDREFLKIIVFLNSLSFEMHLCVYNFLLTTTPWDLDIKPFWRLQWPENTLSTRLKLKLSKRSLETKNLCSITFQTGWHWIQTQIILLKSRTQSSKGLSSIANSGTVTFLCQSFTLSFAFPTLLLLASSQF